jgi:hypothetical protein
MSLMANLAIQVPGPTGLEPAFVPASATGDEFGPGNGHIVLVVKNAGGSPCTVTLVAHRACDQGFLHPKETVIEAGDTVYINSFNPVTHLHQGSQKYQVTYDQVTGVSVAVLQT